MLGLFHLDTSKSIYIKKIYNLSRLRETLVFINMNSNAF